MNFPTILSFIILLLFIHIIAHFVIWIRTYSIDKNADYNLNTIKKDSWKDNKKDVRYIQYPYYFTEFKKKNFLKNNVYTGATVFFNGIPYLVDFVPTVSDKEHFRYKKDPISKIKHHFAEHYGTKNAKVIEVRNVN